uniref:Uncharacterized protein n=1 Tax=Anguilla anguilla TaxID=7936 RepID=A0A0E9QP81_ANGAN
MTKRLTDSGTSVCLQASDWLSSWPTLR